MALATPAVAQEQDWRSDWEVASGYRLDRVTMGLTDPVRVVVVPKPDPSPAAPRLLVLETDGRLAVIDGAGEIRPFFDGLATAALAGMEGEVSARGLALDARTGHLYVGVVCRDPEGLTVSRLARLSSSPRTFDAPPTAATLLRGFALDEPSRDAPRIGPMIVHEGALTVAMDVGGQVALARVPAFANGKLLRMTLDGEPLPDNPHYLDDDRRAPIDYVWARGLRQVEGLAVIGGRIAVTDRGASMDRLVTVGSGDDLLYDGGDWGLGTRADQAWAPSPSVAGLCVAGRDVPVSPEHEGSLFVAVPGDEDAAAGPGRYGARSVLRLAWDVAHGRPAAAPEVVLRYRGQASRRPIDVVAGSDGLFVLVSGDEAADGAVLRLRHDPSDAHPHRVPALLRYYDDPVALMRQKGCLGCHSTEPGVAGVGPTLDRPTLRRSVLTRLESAAYRAVVESLPVEGDAQATDFAARRAEVQAATGDARLRTWIYHHLQEPRFDNPSSQMPQMGVSEEEARILSVHLATDTRSAPMPPDAADPDEDARFGVLHVLLAALIGAAGAWVATVVRRRSRQSG